MSLASGAAAADVESLWHALEHAAALSGLPPGADLLARAGRPASRDSANDPFTVVITGQPGSGRQSLLAALSQLPQLRGTPCLVADPGQLTSGVCDGDVVLYCFDGRRPAGAEDLARFGQVAERFALAVPLATRSDCQGADTTIARIRKALAESATCPQWQLLPVAATVFLDLTGRGPAQPGSAPMDAWQDVRRSTGIDDLARQLEPPQAGRLALLRCATSARRAASAARDLGHAQRPHQAGAETRAHLHRRREALAAYRQNLAQQAITANVNLRTLMVDEPLAQFSRDIAAACSQHDANVLKVDRNLLPDVDNRFSQELERTWMAAAERAIDAHSALAMRLLLPLSDSGLVPPQPGEPPAPPDGGPEVTAREVNAWRLDWIKRSLDLVRAFIPAPFDSIASVMTSLLPEPSPAGAGTDVRDIVRRRAGQAAEQSRRALSAHLEDQHRDSATELDRLQRWLPRWCDETLANMARVGPRERAFLDIAAEADQMGTVLLGQFLERHTAT